MGLLSSWRGITDMSKILKEKSFGLCYLLQLLRLSVLAVDAVLVSAWVTASFRGIIWIWERCSKMLFSETYWQFITLPKNSLIIYTGCFCSDTSAIGPYGPWLDKQSSAELSRLLQRLAVPGPSPYLGLDPPHNSFILSLRVTPKLWRNRDDRLSIALLWSEMLCAMRLWLSWKCQYLP